MNDNTSSSDSRNSYGKYFGICPSFHHSKGCRCRQCPSYPGEGYMFCARGNQGLPVVPGKECLCRDCYVYRQFALEGDRFCSYRTPSMLE